MRISADPSDPGFSYWCVECGVRFNGEVIVPRQDGNDMAVITADEEAGLIVYHRRIAAPDGAHDRYDRLEIDEATETFARYEAKGKVEIIWSDAMKAAAHSQNTTRAAD